MSPRVSVIMPVFDQAAFVERALASLLAQSLSDWELLIVDDGSKDALATRLAPYLQDPRIHFFQWPDNRGMGAALNFGLDRAVAPMIAYLPADDLIYCEHLETLVAALDRTAPAVLAFSGVRHHYNRTALEIIEGSWLQAVQVVHRAGPERWVERTEFVTDDLERMFWSRLRGRGFVSTGLVSCEWVDHPAQRHKVITEPVGGINPYRLRYGVTHPLRFQTSVGNLMDEVGRYRHWREKPPVPRAPDGLKILLVGELAYNAERVLALAEQGHQLYGLWMEDPYWYNTVGPLPFGHVEDLPRSDWQAAIRQVKPDVIYALLNWQAVPFACQVLQANLGIPFVWHFKEGPFICLEKGTWPQLIELYRHSDGQIYSSPEMRDWFMTVVPGLQGSGRSLVIDGDLPKRDWFAGERSVRLSTLDGALHTVVPGRPIGLHPHTVAELATAGIHLHFYGDFTHGQWRAWIDKARGLAPDHLHLHANVDQEHWLAEFSRYDAGWLHFFKSENRGELRRANWDDLNYPARIATLAVAGVPMIQRDNPGAIVATQNLVRERDLGFFCSDFSELAQQLQDTAALERVRANVWNQRKAFTFDYHTDTLIQFFRDVISGTRSRPSGLTIREEDTRFKSSTFDDER